SARLAPCPRHGNETHPFSGVGMKSSEPRPLGPNHRKKKRLGPRGIGNRRDCVSVVSKRRPLLGLAAMDDADQPAPTPEECREVAAELRRMAEEARLSEIQDDLLDLAWRFERMADLFEASMDPKTPGKN